MERTATIKSGIVQSGQLAQGKRIGVLFDQTSTRTRTAFGMGGRLLGAHVIEYGPNDLQLITGESLNDTSRVFAEMLDALVLRSRMSSEEMRSFAEAGPISVINAMSRNEHQTQAISDLFTIYEHFGTIQDLEFVY